MGKMIALLVAGGLFVGALFYFGTVNKNDVDAFGNKVSHSAKAAKDGWDKGSKK